MKPESLKAIKEAFIEGRSRSIGTYQGVSIITEDIDAGIEAAIRAVMESEEVRALVEALEYYANVSDYKAPYTGGLGKLYFDCGERARKALSQLEASHD